MIPPPPRSTLFPYTTLFRSYLRSCRTKPPVRLRRRWREGDWPRGRCSSVTCPGHRAGNTCPARLSGYVRQPEVKGVSIVIILILSDAPWRYYLRQEPDAAIPHVRI